MAARRPSSICLSCQYRQSIIGRRRIHTSPLHRLETVALRPEDDGFVFGRDGNVTEGKTLDQRTNEGVDSSSEKPAKRQKHSDTERETLLSFEALYQNRDLRNKVLRSLSNPWPTFPAHRIRSPTAPDPPIKDSPLLSTNPPPTSIAALKRLIPPEASGGPISHQDFRRNLRYAFGDKAIRSVLRAQLLRCNEPKAILKVVATCMQSPRLAAQLAILSEPTMRSLYRCRQNASDPEVLRCLTQILTRFQWAGLERSPQLIQMGLKFAARSRRKEAMRRYLRMYHESCLGREMTSNIFRSVIAKFSIGHRGLGEIRNGRWKRRDLLEVLLGFEEEEGWPEQEKCHFGTYLVREDWQYLHGWIAVLARCKASEVVWREWEMWKRAEARIRPKRLTSMGCVTSRVRGDYWFLEQMTYTGDLEKAWQLFADASLKWGRVKSRVRERLLDGVEFATLWTEDVRADMVRKWDADLRNIETALGVRWIRAEGGEDGEGQHELFGDQEEALQRLADRPDDEHGFPYADSPIVSEHEEELHCATEAGEAAV